MITSIEIHGLRGIKDGKLDDLTPLTVIVGPNGSGKSTVLDALLIAASPEPLHEIGTVVLRRTGILQGAPWLILTGSVEKRATLEVLSSTGHARKCTLRLDPSVTLPELDARLTAELAEGRYNPDNRRMEYHSHRSGSVHFIWNDGNTANAEDYFHVLDGVAAVHLVEPTSESDLRPLHTVNTETYKLGRRSQVRDIVAQVVPGLVDLPILTEGSRPYVGLEFAGRGAIPVAVAGEGIKGLIRLCLELASVPDGVVLIEEPEVHQHPGAIRQSARAIWAAVGRDVQVILTTHSLELIDALLSEASQDELNKLSVVRTQLRDGCLKTSRLPGEDAALLRTSIEEDLR
jgi:predicted ATPase